MARRRGKLFKQGVQKIVSKIPDKLRATADTWVANTSEGFQTYWVEWINTVLPELSTTMRGLPPKTGNIRQNIIRRSVPVAETISRASRAYRERLMTRLTPAAAAAGGGAPG
jgi:hypothetical protein